MGLAPGQSLAAASILSKLLKWMYPEAPKPAIHGGRHPSGKKEGGSLDSTTSSSDDHDQSKSVMTRKDAIGRVPDHVVSRNDQLEKPSVAQADAREARVDVLSVESRIHETKEQTASAATAIDGKKQANVLEAPAVEPVPPRPFNPQPVHKEDDGGKQAEMRARTDRNDKHSVNPKKLEQVQPRAAVSNKRRFDSVWFADPASLYSGEDLSVGRSRKNRR
jgi:hypothetical protein